MVNNIAEQNLGKFLQIVFSDGIRNQLSASYRDWEMIERLRKGDADGREQRFFFQTSYGPSAIQWAGVSPLTAYPGAQQVTTGEKSALYKEINATIELEYNLWNRARKSPHKYAEPLANEINAKSVASKRRLSIDLYADGTGVLGECSGTPTISAGRLVVTLASANTSRGSVGWFEYGDKLVYLEPDATAATDPTVASGTYAYLSVEAKNREANTVTLAARNAAGTELTITVAGMKNTDVIYREGQPTKINLTTIGSTDYNTLTEVMAGLESLTAADGRVIHGITMSGPSAGSRYSAGGNPLDVAHIQRSMSQTKVNVGEGEYSWSQMTMSPEANDALIESREADRRFQTITDDKRGVKKFAYVHNNDTLEVVTSEFCPKKRIYMIPQGKGGNKVLELYGSDLEVVKPGGQGSEFFLKPASGGGHERVIRSYLEGVMTLINKHPAAVNVVEDFTL